MSGVPAAEKIVFMMISSGTASSAPVVPHTHDQKLSETRIASGLMVLGLVMVFWFPHRRLWALVSPRADGGAEVRLAAASQRDLGLEKDFEQVTAKVRRALSRRQHEEKEGGPHV